MIKDSLAQWLSEAPRYTKPYPLKIDRTPLPLNFHLPEFILFSGDGHTSSIEHMGRFTTQCGEANSDAQKLQLFTNREIIVAELARMSQMQGKTPRDYL
ncbi:hypothetical protein ACE6H2_026503 [Prunus campanulata]